MYQSVDQASTERLPGDGLQRGSGESERLQRRVLRAGQLERHLKRFRGSPPHYPLLLIASRSVETDSPGAKAPGLFVGSIQTIYDVGGGQGRLICAPLKAQPHLTGSVLDLPEVFNDRSRLWATKLGSWLLVSTRANDWDRRGRRGVGRRRSDAGRTRALGQTDAFGDCSLNGALGAIDAFSRRPLFAHSCHCVAIAGCPKRDPFGCGSSWGSLLLVERPAEKIWRKLSVRV